MAKAAKPPSTAFLMAPESSDTENSATLAPSRLAAAAFATNRSSHCWLFNDDTPLRPHCAPRHATFQRIVAPWGPTISPSPRPSRGEGHGGAVLPARGEGQRHAPTSVVAAAPHPSPLPTEVWGEGTDRVSSRPPCLRAAPYPAIAEASACKTASTPATMYAA